MLLEITAERTETPEWLEALLSHTGDCAVACEGLNIRCAVGFTLTDDEGIWEINRAQRGIDRPTDVLSFPTVAYPKGKTARDVPARLRRELDPEAGGVYLGDIIISLPRAREQAAEYGHSLRREVGFLFAHGMLHLMGYDHMEEDERAIMRGMEEKIMEKANLPRELTDGDWELIEEAKRISKNAYTPYSHYNVGACIRTADGRMFHGCNVEQASYGLGICAERNAATTAVAEGAREFTAIAIYTPSEQTTPCGACRQFLREFCKDMKVILVSGKGILVTTLKALLPLDFGPENLLSDEVNK